MQPFSQPAASTPSVWSRPFSAPRTPVRALRAGGAGWAGLGSLCPRLQALPSIPRAPRVDRSHSPGFPPTSGPCVCVAPRPCSVPPTSTGCPSTPRAATAGRGKGGPNGGRTAAPAGPRGPAEAYLGPPRTCPPPRQGWVLAALHLSGVPSRCRRVTSRSHWMSLTWNRGRKPALLPC